MDISTQAIAATLFVHFTNAATGEPIYKTDEAGEFELDANEKKIPVGVNVYGPGSVQYRNAQAELTTEALERRRNKKNITGHTLMSNEVELLARTTIGFVGFTYKGGDGSTLDNRREFYNDVALVHFKEQVSDKQGDVANFSQKGSNA